ncbi:MAG: monovalent cation/H(+) antiporter subunit G [Candidatus Diapherotrites archaeon]
MSLLLFSSYVLILFGILFHALGAIALFRFPDVYTRMHGTTMITTFGSIFVVFGVSLYGFQAGDFALIVHPLIALVFLLLSAPASSHAIARAAHNSGVFPKPAIVDRLKEAKK